MTTDTHENDDTPQGTELCNIAAEHTSLEAQRIRMMLTPEGMKFMRTTLELEAEFKENVVVVHRAGHDLDSGKITADEYREIADRFDDLEERIDAHVRAEDAFFAEIDRKIVDAKERIEAGKTEEFLGLLLLEGKPVGGVTIILPSRP